MHSDEPAPDEESLDPEDWHALRVLGHQMLDDMLTYLQTIRDRPVWQPIPDQIRDQFQEPLPLDPQSPEHVYKAFLLHILPYPWGNIHPRFWGWVVGTGTPLGMLAEMLAAGFNPNVWGGNHVAGYVEVQVLNWLKEIVPQRYRRE